MDFLFVTISMPTLNILELKPCLNQFTVPNALGDGGEVSRDDVPANLNDGYLMKMYLEYLFFKNIEAQPWAFFPHVSN